MQWADGTVVGGIAPKVTNSGGLNDSQTLPRLSKAEREAAFFEKGEAQVTHTRTAQHTHSHRP